MSLLLLVGVAAVACSTAPTTAPPPDVVGVDDEDVQCDPLDGAPDDATSAPEPTPEPLTQWVDPFVGTGGVAFGVGTTYPGPQVPGGMARPGPDTSHAGGAADFMHCSGYAHDDDVIDGFSEMRLEGAGIADYGGMALMPTLGVTGEATRPRGHGSHFSHDREQASPGYYAVTLDDTHIQVELTASAHVGFQRYTFPQGADATVLVDAGHLLADNETVTLGHVDVDAQAKEVSGFEHVAGSYSRRFGGVRVYFVARFDRAWASAGTFADGVLADASVTAEGTDVGAYLHFDASSTTTVGAHVGVSFVDVAHARANLDAEDTSFDQAKTAAQAAWEARLGRVRIEARTDHDRRLFYTALYHTAQMPALASDVDGSYRGIDGNVHAAKGFRYFTDFSLWDTYRTLQPLLDLVYPEDAGDMAQSLVAMGEDAGYLPRWPLGTGETGGMIGDGATVALADAYLRGVTGWDAQGGYAIARHQATTVPAPNTGGRDDMQDWLSLGYVSNDGHSSAVSKTLEYAVANAALGRWAAAMGHADDAAMFGARGGAWRKLYDPGTHLLLPMSASGALVPQVATAMGGPYTEGSAWQYDFFVPEDVQGLSDAMTRPVLEGRLEQLFTRAACTGKAVFLPNPYYWPGNEPSLFAGWIFAALGDRARAGRWLRWATLAPYAEGPAGLPGNDDSGTMSAFYVFAALGFYPIAGTDQFVIGSPLFPHATVATPAGSITLDAPGASDLSRFVAAVTRNGENVSPVVAQSDLAGATLHFEMTASPP